MACSSKSDQIKVTIELNSPGLSAETKVFVTGNQPGLGNWDPGVVEMKQQSDGIWSKTIALEQPTTLEYKFTLGSWDRENAHEDNSPLPNFRVEIARDTVLKNQVDHWKDGQKQGSQVTGQVKYHRGLKSKGLKDRDVIVWLPPGYDTDLEKRYPVLYMHDGQNIFDPSTSFLGLDWRADETADSLIRAGLIDPLIIVGINNTEDRREEYGTGKLADLYMDFVIQKVKPLIDGEYRTQPLLESTFTGGSSMGGLISMRLHWEHATTFSAALCFSPAFRIRDLDYVPTVADHLPPKPPVLVYIDNGGVDLETELQPGIDDMLAALEKWGIREGQGLHYVKDPAATHNEGAWARRFPGALLWLMLQKMP
ncbi:MAG: histidine kinase [Bacteroidia bacterium]|nr:histidine kinase [Bacteroidia bacterium]